MTISEFLALDEASKTDAVWKGNLLDIIEDGNNSLLLYNMGSFYVEVSYNQSESRICKLRAFKNTKSLDKYLKNYSLPVIRPDKLK